MKRLFRPIFSPPLLVFKHFFGSKLDTFVGGLMFGAIFSLLVNIATVKVQEDILKQRILESLEYEILNNVLTANSVLENNPKLRENNQKPNLFSRPSKYNDRVWNNTEVLKYSVELKPEQQAALSAFYEVAVPGANYMVEKGESIADEKLKTCHFENKYTQDCLEIYHLQLLIEEEAAKVVYSPSYKLLQDFHPTRDRLSSRWLKMLMGKEAIGALKVPPK